MLQNFSISGKLGKMGMNFIIIRVIHIGHKRGTNIYIYHILMSMYDFFF